MQARKNILQNSLEQSVFSLLSQLAMVVYLTPVMTIRLIPIMNYLWFFARIAFMCGYPHYRGFGFSVTFNPGVIATLYAIGMFVKTEWGGY